MTHSSLTLPLHPNTTLQSYSYCFPILLELLLHHTTIILSSFNFTSFTHNFTATNILNPSINIFDTSTHIPTSSYLHPHSHLLHPLPRLLLPTTSNPTTSSTVDHRPHPLLTITSCYSAHWLKHRLLVADYAPPEMSKLLEIETFFAKQNSNIEQCPSRDTFMDLANFNGQG
ncbi:hypothetical protein Pcinc_023305 [Petrolisthes cinctipes]|uniref:Uncharacterized protein n=1 Tax=Petrolisthes cinctipes TaxID=88211 RepID=A0AAE1FDU3_PETCI|nr:hypothetical protein Pcinc_023305 [Petrolisthes cinctipes]